MLLGVLITNMGESPCYLQGPPNIDLVDSEGQVLDIDYSLGCFLCKGEENQLLSARAGIAPRKHVTVRLFWDNWCQPFPKGGIWVRLMLPNANVEGPADARFGGRCDVPWARSRLGVAQYNSQ
jgi:hypothetical protein